MTFMTWKPFASRILLAGSLLAAASSLALASSPITGVWEGAESFRGQQVPIRLEIAGTPGHLKADLLNGPATKPEKAPATTVTFKDGHLVVIFGYYAKSLDLKLDGDTLSGTWGFISPGTAAHPNLARAPVTLHLANAASLAAGPDIHGDWEIAVPSTRSESAWQLRIAATSQPGLLHAVIQRIDGDTGPLYGSWDPAAKQYIVSHFTAHGPALYSIAPQADGTLLVSNLIIVPDQKAANTNLVARRPEEARRLKLAAPEISTEHTQVKDPSVPFAFSFPDLSGKLISNTDPQFRGKVVIVTIGGSWCPNCHDEAPFLESLYQRFHSKGLEIVNLSFEEEDQLQNPVRLRAFIQRYGLTYTVLLCGTTDQLNEKVPQGVNLNSWPTSFLLGRDGLVKEIHTGFAGPANVEGHKELVAEVTATVEKLLAQPVPQSVAAAAK